MYKLIEFIRRIYVVLLFILIEAIALNYYAHSTTYTQAKILSRANSVKGGLQNSIFSVRHYFTLRSENQMLSERVAQLENSLAYYRESVEKMAADTVTMWQMDSLTQLSLTQYRYHTARVVGNTINRPNNFIILNRGLQQGVMADMAVITPDGCMVGYVVECSDNYSVAKSILNTDFHTSGMVPDGHFGSISWDGHSPHRVQLRELTKYSEFGEGDEIISSGQSTFFPKGVRIGYVVSSRENENHISMDVEVRLAADMTRLSNVLLINNNDFVEITTLEKSAKEAK